MKPCMLQNQQDTSSYNTCTSISQMEWKPTLVSAKTDSQTLGNKEEQLENAVKWSAFLLSFPSS